MKKIFKTLLSMEVMIVLLIFFALSCAIATFIENDFGPLGAKSFVYGQKWFELIMLILITGIIFHIFWSKMYKKNRLFILLIHSSLILIFIGAGLTRYFGYEATMTIPEGSMENRVYSLDDYIQVRIGDKEYSEKIFMTQLNQTNFKFESKINDKTIEIKFNKFIKNGIEKIVEDKNGKPIINILFSQANGTKSVDLTTKESFDSGLVLFNFNKEVVNSTKPSLNIETINSKFFISSNVELGEENQITKEIDKIKLNEKRELKTGTIYKIGQTQFMIAEASLKGSLKIVSAHDKEIDKETQKDVLLMDILYNDKKIELPIFGKNSFPKKLNYDGTQIEIKWGAKEMKLPFYILLNDFKLERYPGSKSPSAYSSDVKVYDKEEGVAFEYKIFMNNVLDYKGFRFFQSSYKMDESATILSVNKDPGKIPTYIGYFMLFTGLILSLFIKNSRFKKLSSTKYSSENIKQLYYSKKSMLSILAILLMFSSPLESFSSENIDFDKKVLSINKQHSQEFGKLLIQDYQGRIKPINSLAIEIINKISRKNKIYDLDANQFFLSMMLYPEVWKNVNIFKVKTPQMKRVLNINESQNLFKFNDIYRKDGAYKLENYLEIANSKKASQRDKFDKELIKIDERLNISYSLFIGDFFKAFPIKHSPTNKWVNLNETMEIDSKYSSEINKLIKNYYFSLITAVETNNWNDANKNLESISSFQNRNSTIIPNSLKVKAELIFNKYNIFEKLTPFYLILGLVLLLVVFINIFTTSLNVSIFSKYTLYLLSLAFIIHTIGLALRWYISGHAPWSNGYESMIYIAWAIILSGIFFSKHSTLALATTSILSGVTLFVAHLSWMEPQITTLTPVLKSYWLTIHVSVITASYGFLALSALLGFIVLILFIFANHKNENERFFRILLSIKEANRINMMAIFIGVVFLIIGNFLGGIWANESWGRYWGWDPKETWTLVSIIIYTVIIHLKYVKNFLSEFNFSVFSVISYFSIIMTYFGVNYYLSGKHSYAAGDPIPIPTFVPVSLLILFVIIALAYRNRKVI